MVTSLMTPFQKTCGLFFGLYLSLCAACFFPKSTGFSEEWLLPKWYLTIMVSTIIVMTEAVLRTKLSPVRIPRVFLFSIALSVTTFLESLYALITFFFQDKTEETGISGTFDNPAGLALSLCLSLPFMYHVAQKSRRKTMRAIQFVTIIPAVAALWLSQSRTGLLCFAGFLTIMACTHPKSGKKTKAAIIVSTCAGALLFTVTRKQDSSNGRWFILERSWELITQNPWTGHGRGGFEREYMLVQAEYFASHPNSDYAWLADEVRHPLNEFVLAWINYGVAVPIMLVLSFVVAIVTLAGGKNGFSPALACSLAALFLFACFSYPFKYPLSWVMASLAPACLWTDHLSDIFHKRVQRAFPAILWGCSAIILTGLATEYHYDRKWSRAAQLALHGQSARAMPVYSDLYRHYARNPYFLYNYAAELFYAGHFHAALQIAEECRTYWASYNLELLTGDIFRHLKQYRKAHTHYQLAAHMCPVRFAPLEGMYLAYKASGNIHKADSVANIIQAKEIKVISPEIIRIKNETNWKNPITNSQGKQD